MVSALRDDPIDHKLIWLQEDVKQDVLNSCKEFRRKALRDKGIRMDVEKCSDWNEINKRVGAIFRILENEILKASSL